MFINWSYSAKYVNSYIYINNSRRGHNRMTPRRSSIIQSLDIRPPLRLINALQTTVVGHQPVDLALDVCSLGPDTTAAREPPCLVGQFAQQDVAAVVPAVDCLVQFVCLIDGVDGCLVVPQTIVVRVRGRGLGLVRVCPELTVRWRRCYPHRRIRLGSQCVSGRRGLTRWSRMDCRTAGWRSGGCPGMVSDYACFLGEEMRAYAEVSSSVVEPTGRRINQASRIQ